MNECSRGSIGIALIVEKMREYRSRRFGHIMRRKGTESVRIVLKINVKEKRKRGRSKN